ncbi:MAG: PaaI family thioesterase [bacterium]
MPILWASFTDAAMGMAYASLLNDSESFSTLELKINFMRPIWESQLRVVGHELKHGQTIGGVECEIFDEQQELFAIATSICMTLRG